MTRANLDSNGFEGARWCSFPAISANGRFIAFHGAAALVPNDNNGYVEDAYLYDAALDVVELISVNMSGGTSALGVTWFVSVSDDGNRVAFVSNAHDLVPGGALPAPKAYLRDRLSGTTTLLSVSPSGLQGNCLVGIKICGDGSKVAFASSTHLIPGDTNGANDVFVRDLALGTIERASVSSSNAQGNAGSGGFDGLGMSSDGRYVCFSSRASNLVTGDVDSWDDVFLRDRATGQTTLISIGLGGNQVDGYSSWSRCSEDGGVVVFESNGSTLVWNDGNGLYDIFVRDVLLGATTRVSEAVGGGDANGDSHNPELSPDGRFVSYYSDATNLVPGDTNGCADVFVYDRITKKRIRVSTDLAGVEGNGHSYGSALSRNADSVAFDSFASNLIVGDTNAVRDVFVRRCIDATSYCTAKTNSQGCVPALAFSGTPSTSWSAGFWITSSNLINHQPGVLVYSLQGSAALPFQGGTLCVRAPVRRTTPQSTGGNSGPLDCTGSLAVDFNAWVATGVDAALVPGRHVWAQLWSRDPGFASPAHSGLTDAVRFVLAP